MGDPRVDPRIRLAIELAAECRTGQVLRCTRRMLVPPDLAPNGYEAAPPGALGQVEVPDAGKKHGEVVVLTPAGDTERERDPQHERRPWRETHA
jgi:hypothetical protein